MNITSAETLLKWAHASDSSYTGAIHAREAFRIASMCRAARAPSVARVAAELALERAKQVPTTAPATERAVAKRIELESEQFLEGKTDVR